MKETKPVTICVCCYGDNFHLAERCIGSILENFDSGLYDLRVGCNRCCEETINYVKSKNVNKIFLSEKNLFKNGMMRLLFEDLRSKYVLWFDDDSHVLKNCLEDLLKRAEASCQEEAIFGSMAKYHTLKEIERDIGIDKWIKSQLWYRGKKYPSATYEEGQSDFYFIRGGNYLAKTDALARVYWPSDPTGYIFSHAKFGEDIILGEALHQNDYRCVNLGTNYGIKIDDSPTRT